MKSLILALAASAALLAQTQTPVQSWTDHGAERSGASVAPIIHAAELHSSAINLKVNKSIVLDHPGGIRRVAIANGDIAEAVGISSTELLVNGKASGETSLIVWDEKGNRSPFELHVAADETTLQSVRQELTQEVGDDVTLTEEGANVFLRGTVQTAIAADRAFTIASAAGKVVNLLNVAVPAGDPQILLKVRFASLNRTLSNQLGINIFGNQLKGVGNSTTGQFGQYPLFNDAKTTVTDLLNIFYYRPDLGIGAMIRDLQAKNVLQILAEPNVLAMNGRPASFLAGGEFPFPTLQGGGSGIGQITIQFKEFGIKLNFLPTITPRGTIHMVLTPEVSSLDYASGLTVSGFTVPGLATRRVETEVELENGQSFAIAGLLDNQVTENLDKMPGLANIPILGKLFESRSTTKSNTELLVIITPELVRPIPAGDKLPQLETPKKFMPGDLPPHLQNPLESKTNLGIVRQTSIPVEQLKTSAKGAAIAAPPAVAPVLPGGTPNLTAAAGPGAQQASASAKN
jgi:pilus assembly protein CpaC